VAIEVFAADEQADHPVETLRWVRLAEAVLEEEGIRGDAELSMLFVDEQAMADLNKRFLGRDGPTDVLAFPIDEEPVEGGRSPDSGGSGPGFSSEPSDMPIVLGDVVICPAVAHRNAAQRAGTYDDELALLIVHGVLHLLGMDHEDDDEAELMESRERQLLAKLNRAPGAPDDPDPETGGDPRTPSTGATRPLGPRAGRTPARRPPGPSADAPTGGPWDPATWGDMLPAPGDPGDSPTAGYFPAPGDRFTGDRFTAGGSPGDPAPDARSQHGRSLGGDSRGGDSPGDDSPGDDSPGDDSPGDDSPGDDSPVEKPPPSDPS
jgi:probable rRNA maturation factor